MQRLLPLSVLYLVVTAIGYAAAALQFPHFIQTGGSSGIPSAFFWAMIACATAAVLIQVFSGTPRRYLSALAFQFVATLLMVPVIVRAFSIELAAYVSLTVGICLYNPFPVNLTLSAAANALLMIVRAWAMARGGVPSGVILKLELEYGSFAMLITIFASFMVWYRSRLIDSTDEQERLNGLVSRLTSANLQYQEYAMTVGESSVEGERKRITRDIHDIVGYTLTNNITIMEAITDVIRTNPLGVSRLVDTARENAQEGLTRIRESLRQLRASEVVHPRGVAAVQRLIDVFQTATGVRVELAFSEVPWDFSETIDSALYHVIQESLVNAFRHGKATRVLIFLSRRAGTLTLKIQDNGVGASVYTEGIGIAGMRERLAKLGGSLETGSTEGGFDLTATLKMSS